MTAHREVVRANNLDAAYIRPLVFLGSEGMGLRAEGPQNSCGYRRMGLAFLYVARNSGELASRFVPRLTPDTM